MLRQLHGSTTKNNVPNIESHVQSRLGGRVRYFRIEQRDGGLILKGLAHTFHAKQLAQHAVMESTDLPILANEIEVV